MPAHKTQLLVVNMDMNGNNLKTIPVGFGKFSKRKLMQSDAATDPALPIVTNCPPLVPVLATYRGHAGVPKT